MYYEIVGLCPRSDLSISAWGFGVTLFPQFKEAAIASGLDQAKMGKLVETTGRSWLDGCGFDTRYDPDDERPAFERDEAPRKMGPNARPLYQTHSIRITWGEWGPEHITVPGNACGLDIDSGVFAPEGGMVLNPHNVDCMRQAMLLLIVFTFLAESITIQAKGSVPTGEGVNTYG